MPVQFDPTPLTTGTVDGWFSFITNEPNLLKVKGIDTATFLLADYNYPLVSETLHRAQEHDQERAGQDQGRADGRHQGLARQHRQPGRRRRSWPSPSTAGAWVWPKPEQTLESKAQNALILTADTKANGIFTITPDLLSKTIATLARRWHQHHRRQAVRPVA